MDKFDYEYDDGVNAARGVLLGMAGGVAAWSVIALCVLGVMALLRG